MSNASETSAKRWRDIVNLILGGWLFVSPWVLAAAPIHTVAWNAYLMGAIIVIAAIWALADFEPWEEWVNLVVGVWLLISPWVIGVAVSGALVWSCVVVGVVVALLALWTLIDVKGQGGQDAHA